MKEPIGIAVLTNGNRLGYLKQNLEAFIENTSYRPLVFGIFDNGSTDGTPTYINSLINTEGVTFRKMRSEADMGCGVGVNRANDLVKEFEYTIFLESDWTLLEERESGWNKEWLDECLDFMKTGKCDYLYLRRFPNVFESRFHDYQHVMAHSGHQEGRFLYITKFMYSNNPHIRRTKVLYDQGILPLREFIDANGLGIEKKGNPTWSQAEHSAKQPEKLWFTMWGMFGHETTVTPKEIRQVGCDKYGPFGCSTCKYGFTEFNAGFCALCDFSKDWHDLKNHTDRFIQYYETMLSMRRLIKPTIGNLDVNPGSARKPYGIK
jgi:glycosyltransferase involved in cell wall biosynthesis